MRRSRYVEAVAAALRVRGVPPQVAQSGAEESANRLAESGERWDPEPTRVVVPQVGHGLVGERFEQAVIGLGDRDLRDDEAARAAEILDGFEAAREAFQQLNNGTQGPDDRARLRAFFQVEAEP